MHAIASLGLGVALWLSTPYLLLGRRIHYRILAPGAALTAGALMLVGWAPGEAGGRG